MNFPSFDLEVGQNGYRWWYLDAMSDDGQHTMTIIVFVGSVFSPYYSWARQRSGGNPENFCSFNVALYGPGGRWCMTERDRKSVSRRANSLSIGKSRVELVDQQLHYHIDEFGCPLPFPIQGHLKVDIPQTLGKPLALDAPACRHHWQSLGAQSRISVNLEKPEWNWSGNAYVDSNWGSAPLEDTFSSWQWSRAHLPDRSTLIHYDTELCNGDSSQQSMLIDASGKLSESNLQPLNHTLPSTNIWRIARQAHTDPTSPSGATAAISRLKTLEDTPFYSRSQFDTTVEGLQANCIHESLDLTRFKKRWVRYLLPFRMPRNTATKLQASSI